MNIKKIEKNGYTLLKVIENLNIRSSLAELKSIVAQNIEKGSKYIAVSFTPNSFFNSEAVAACVQCVELMREAEGNLAIVRPNEQIKDILKITDLTELVKLVDSEDDLQAPA